MNLSGGGQELVAIGEYWIGIDPGFPAVLVSCSPWDSTVTLLLYVRKDSEAYSARVTVDSDTGACPQPFLTCPVTYSYTNLALGATVDRNTTTGVVRHRFRLFVTSSSVGTYSVGGRSSTITGIVGSQVTPSLGVSRYRAGYLGAIADFPDGIQITDIEWGGDLDPTGDLLYPIQGGALPLGHQFVATTLLYPPLRYTADVDVRDAGGAQPAHTVRVGGALPADYTDVANPSSTALTKWRWTSSGVAAALQGSWDEAGVSPFAADLIVPLRKIPPLRPGDAPESWQPSTYQITSPLSVLRSSNNCSGTGSVALSGTGNLIWTVTGAATVTRQLLEKWRAWNTFADPDYHADDGYTTTKADYYGADGQDRWGWGLFAYLDVDLTAPANGSLTLSVTWAAAGASLNQVTKTYTVPAITGRHTYRVDLLFPNEGGPFYGERVDTISVSGFVNGVYQLHDLSLVADEDAYVKVHARGTYSGLVIAQDGQFSIGQWGTNPLIGAGPARQKDDESGLFSSGAGTDTSWGGAVRMDGTLQAVMTEWNRMEGITTTYSGSAVAADLTDGTNVAGTENELSAVPIAYSARWYDTMMAGRAPANAAQDLDASVYADGGADLCAAPAGTFVLPFRHTLGMMLEAQVRASGGGREAPGTVVTARIVGVGTALGTGTTDASGYVEVPIPTGTVSGSDFTAVLEV